MSNTKHSISKRLKRFSMIKLFIGKPEIKHINNKVIITVYTYNRKKIYFLNKIKKISNLNGHNVNKFSNNRSKSILNNSLITRSSNKLPLVNNKKVDLIHRLKTPKHSTISIRTNFNLTQKSNLNIFKNSHGENDKTFIGMASPASLAQKRFIHNLKIKKNTLPSTGPANTLKLLKIRLKKRNKVLFNVLKNKPISFFFPYIASQLVKGKPTKTTYAVLANSPTKTQTNLGMPYLSGSHTNASLNFILSKIAFNKSKRTSYASFVKKNAILKNKIIQIQPILRLVYPSNLSSITTLMELKKNPLTQI